MVQSDGDIELVFGKLPSLLWTVFEQESFLHTDDIAKVLETQVV